jgi:hypothetical protein
MIVTAEQVKASELGYVLEWIGQPGTKVQLNLRNVH